MAMEAIKGGKQMRAIGGKMHRGNGERLIAKMLQGVALSIQGDRKEANILMEKAWQEYGEKPVTTDGQKAR